MSNKPDPLKVACPVCSEPPRHECLATNAWGNGGWYSLKPKRIHASRLRAARSKRGGRKSNAGGGT